MYQRRAAWRFSDGPNRWRQSCKVGFPSACSGPCAAPSDGDHSAPSWPELTQRKEVSRRPFFAPLRAINIYEVLLVNVPRGIRHSAPHCVALHLCSTETLGADRFFFGVDMPLLLKSSRALIATCLALFGTFGVPSTHAASQSSFWGKLTWDTVWAGEGESRFRYGNWYGPG